MPRRPRADDGTEFGRLRGRLDWPVAGRVVANFGATRASGVDWDGIVDAALAEATLQRPVAEGYVSEGKKGLHSEHLGFLLAALDIAGAEPALLEAVFAVVQRLLRTEPAARLACLMLTSFSDDEALFDAILAGASGYVL